MIHTLTSTRRELQDFINTQSSEAVDSDDETQDLLKAVWMSQDFVDDNADIVSGHIPVTKGIATATTTVSDKNIGTTETQESTPTTLETKERSVEPYRPSLQTKGTTQPQLVATKHRRDISLQTTSDHARRHRFEDKLADESRVSPSPAILERLRRHKAIRHLSESDRQAVENVFLLRMAARHLIRLVLLTNNLPVVKALFQSLRHKTPSGEPRNARGRS